MSEQEVIEQLTDYGDWLTGMINTDIRPTGVQLVDAENENLASLDDERLRRESHVSFGPRRSLMLVAAVLAIAAAGWFAASQRVGTEEPAEFRGDLVLPGEIVIEEDPLIVAAAFAPEPQFDTSDLGAELVWEPVLEIDDETRAVIAAADGIPDNGQREIVKLTVLGKLLGQPWIVDVRDGPVLEGVSAPPGVDVMRFRNISEPGGSGGSVSADLVIENDRLFIDHDTGPIGQIGRTDPTGWLVIGQLPEGTAVVGFEDSDQKRWLRPRGNRAAFRAQFDLGETATVTAYAVDGTVLGSITVGGSDNQGPTSWPVNPGDAPGLKAIDLDSGDAITIGDNAKPLILLVGAAWCQPCADFEQDIPFLESLGDSVEVYGVSVFEDPLYSTEPWPGFEGWNFPRVRLPEVSAGFFPAALVVDSDGKLLATLRDINNLEGILVDLGIAPG